MRNAIYFGLFIGFLHTAPLKASGQFINVSRLTYVKFAKAAMDKDFQNAARHNQSKLLIYVKIPKRKILKRIFNKKFPDEVEYTYNVLRDTVNNSTLILASPFSESGDWDISYIHYFDAQGKLIAFERRTGFFNSECTDDAAHETICKYYNADFKQISVTYKLTDSKGKKLDKVKCIFNYDFKDYKIYRNINECLKGYNLKL